MFVRLDQGLFQGPYSPAIEMALETALHMHRGRAHILVMTPAEVLSLRQATFLGIVARTVLEAIGQHASDYASTERSVDRRLLLCRDDLPGVFEARTGGEIAVGLQWYTKRYSDGQASIFVENVNSDADGISYVLRCHGHMSRWPIQFVNMNFRHGGGSGVAAVLKALDPKDARGLCIVDRDCPDEVPPLKKGSTAHAAAGAATAAGWLEQDGYGYSGKLPTFGFETTAGWSIENYVGPNALRVYLNANHGTAATTNALRRAFPTFPTLSEIETWLWMRLNFKQPHLCSDALRAAVKLRWRNDEVIERVCDRLGGIQMPGGTVHWCAENVVGGQFRRPLLEAFREDCKADQYSEAYARLVGLIRTLLAGDVRMAQL